MKKGGVKNEHKSNKDRQRPDRVRNEVLEKLGQFSEGGNIRSVVYEAEIEAKPPYQI